MDMKERIRHLCKINHVSMNRVEGDLGFGKGYLSKLGTSKPNAEKLKKIADYFNVSLDFIMTGKEENEEKNQRIDIKDELERMRDLLKNRTRHPIYYDGEKLDDESLDAILAQYEMSLIYLKQKNK
ncbi:helix-turn-helix domain-containing protein [Anaerostipes sp. Marseille-Q3525]|uniref:helix-turn-helix domain-containing protein n=1 Tax=Anaerostipes sp. Marseille-Q3525 TaxID=2758418 RepID=UPI001BAC2F52|nr:helix-turn-helix transcriptional regulator [Anaerostipes sp. Marseille-Q3525]MBR9961707.1 helix-turn-helix transcriptional regulator [Anaerostipes sp. Marseille-Q3525]